MAKNIKGIIIELGAETKGLDKALADVNKQSRDIQKELREVNKLLKFNPKDTELLSQKQKLLGDQVSATKEKLDRLKAAEAQVQEQFKKGEITEEQYRAYQREIVETESKLKHYENQLKEVTRENNSFAQSMEAASKKLNDVGSKMQDVGEDLTKKVTLPLVGIGTAATKLGVEFEKSMSEVAAVSGASAEELQQLEKAARDAGATTDKSARDAADALKYMALAGWDVETSQKALMPVLKMSSAAGIELGKTSDLVTDSMSSLGLTVDELNRYLDVVSLTQSKANTSAEGMMEAYVKAGGTFKNMNVSIDESAAMLGILANRGMKGAEAGNSLNSVMVNLSGSTDKTRKIFDELGIAIYDQQGNYIGLEATLEQLKTKFDGMTEAERNYYMAQLVGKSQIDTMTKLMDGLGNEYYDLKGQIEGADGALEQMYDTATNNTMGAINNLKSALEELGLKIFDSLQPTIESLIEKVQKLTDWFNNLSPSTQENIVKFGMLAAAIGPLLILGGKMAEGTSDIIDLGLKLAPVIGGLNLKFLAIAGPIAAAIAAGVLLYKNWDTIKQKANQLGSFLSSKFKQIGDFISKPFKAAADFVGRQVKRIKEFFSKLKLKIPEPKVPKFELTGKFNLMPPSVPRIKVKWNAKGGLMDGATLFGARGNTLLGGGEAGKEGIVPLEGKHMYPLADAIADRLNITQGGQVIVENMYVRDDTDIHLISRELFNLNKQVQRARGRK